MATIYVEGRPYPANAEQNLLHVCLTLGFNLPFFCWHPAMGSVGACRQCAVKQFKGETDRQGRIVMACMTPASEGARISIEDAEASEFRKAVIEGLMLNHPHDCPVCDEGGECHLQDMTVMTGHDYRRYGFSKRTFHNQYLGPFVNHEMNRCIQCYRCVRFYREYAGGLDLNAFALHDTVFFGRHEDGTLESEFSGNLVEVCPTGVFTDATLKQHYTRKWDLRMAPSVCVHCGLGCNTTPGERYGTLRRIVNRYNHDVNGYFLCDRGRFGYEFVNSPRRIRRPLVRRNGQAAPESKEAALNYAGALLSGGVRVMAIGSPRASLEANFALRKLAGEDGFYAGVPGADLRLQHAMLDILFGGPARSPSLRDIEESDAVLVLGEDLPNVAPRMALALRQSVLQQPKMRAKQSRIPLWLDHAVRELIQNERGPLFIATPDSTRIDDIAARTLRAAPEDIARLGFAVAHLLDSRSPRPQQMSEEVWTLAGAVAGALAGAARPLVVSGGSLGSEDVIRAAANVSRALHAAGKPASLAFTAPEPNSFGLAMMAGRSLDDALQAAHYHAPEVLVVLENDLFRRAPAEQVNGLLEAAGHIVILDSLAGRTSESAEVALPAASFAEGDGTFVSSEGRAQRFFQVFTTADDIQESWRWLRDLMAAAGNSDAGRWQNLDDILNALAAELPQLHGILDAAPGASFREDGCRIPRAPHRYSGRTAMLAHIDVSEPKPPDDPDSALSFSMEGCAGTPPAPLIPFFWEPGWNSIQSVKRFQVEVGGPLRRGPAGTRLIEPAPQDHIAFFQQVPEAFHPRPEQWLFVPVYHIFGSDELSLHAPAVAERCPAPYVALNADEASKLQLDEGEIVAAGLGETVFHLPVRILNGLPAGVAAYPFGIPPLEGISGCAWSRIWRLP